ncbi:ArnT family glycosyltransferase [Horticoccus sp. 23ND18S-11]|uniref:ArnT family glycosyltransferase n=1 Tax=Horticoccus sp. 23ND18S-11 TaxID=3391832 RepID=UPI0039C93099
MIAALFSAWTLGVLLVAVLRPAGSSWRRDGAVLVSLGLLLGLGVTSTLFFFASLASARPAFWAGAGELALGAFLAWRLARRATDGTESKPMPASNPVLWWILAWIFGQIVVVATVVAWRSYLAEPYGGWDGWAIWNLHARFMLRAGPEWPLLLAAPSINWTHPDYPRLLPAAVARIWAWAGTETSAAAALVSGAFAAGLVGLLVAVVARVRGLAVGLLGGIVLVGTPFFVTFAPNQHADIPLAGFMLAAVGLVALGDRRSDTDRGWFALAGLCAGLAAWTKNEGLLFALAFAAVVAAWAEPDAGRRNLARLLAGLAIALVPVVVFKIWYAPANDLMAAPFGPRLAQLIDAVRLETVLRAFGREGLRFGEWSLTPFAVMALPFVAWRARRRWTGGERVIPAVLALMLAGYATTYLLSPLHLQWHLDTSLVRLLLQLWPMAIVAWCLAVPAFEPARPVRASRGWAVGFAVTSVAAALGTTWTLSRQLAVGELSLRRDGNATITAAWGAGWYPPEQHGRDRWAWSGGRAALQLYVDGGDLRAPVAIRCRLRATVPRTVVVTLGGRELWRGAVATNYVDVVLALPPWAAGTAALEFSTDIPGTPETPDGGGRVLAFALYNVELR